MIVFDGFKIVKAVFKTLIWALTNPIAVFGVVISCLGYFETYLWSRFEDALTVFVNDTWTLPISGFGEWVFSGEDGLGNILGYVMGIDWLLTFALTLPYILFNLVYWSLIIVIDLAIAAIVFKYASRFAAAIFKILT